MVFDDDTLRASLAIQVIEKGSISALARSLGLHDEHLRMFMNGKRPAEPKVLQALGLKKIVLYTPEVSNG